MKKLARSIRDLFRAYPRLAWGSVLLLLIAYVCCLPRPLFDDPTCMVLEDRDGNLLGARIATDGQWRFPGRDTLPETFVQALIEFEDQRFYSHPGIDPASLGRAMMQNIRSGHIVSGGSTITMQVMRMARKNRPRTVIQKLIEMVMATRLELGYSKNEILALYAAHAPFGGNVVGLDAASWRYFGKRPELLSWAEAATLAVLPNSPALIHPGRNRQALEEKRNRLLDRLQLAGHFSAMSLELAKEEPLPAEPLPLPRLAPHLMDRANAEYVNTGKVQQSRIRTTLRHDMQVQLNGTLQRHQQQLRANGIYNLAALVIDIETGEVVAYVGNILGAGEEHGEAVDVITAPRSTGSILKPFLYALALQDGKIVPTTLIPDVPTQLSGYRPENYHEKYDGAVTARRALIRSLNVPMVWLLQQYGLEKFHFYLRKLGFSTITYPPNHYGLTLILGGAEATLWDITSAYAGMARTLNHRYDYNGRYDPADFQPPHYLLTEKEPAAVTPENLQKEPPLLGAAPIWLTFDAMREVERPNSEGEWQNFSSGRRIAWKTGTSFGFRDAWAVGVTPRYAVGVWAGNADGEGRPGLVGVQAAAPVLFDIFNRLPTGAAPERDWFDPPYDDLIRLPVCRESGYRVTSICPADTIWAPANSLKLDPCPYHRLVHLDANRQWQVRSDCESPQNMVHQPWFVLPPLEEYYFKSNNPAYRTLPPFRKDCPQDEVLASMQLIYPKYPTKIYVPVDLDGKLSRTVFEVAHRNPAATIYWHIDEEYIGSTAQFHSKELNPPVGIHVLTLVDENGERLQQAFEIIRKEK